MLMHEQMFFEPKRSLLILRIFRSASGQWSGQMFQADKEIASVGACLSPDEVRQAANASSLYPDKVIIAA